MILDWLLNRKPNIVEWSGDLPRKASDTISPHLPAKWRMTTRIPFKSDLEGRS